MIKLNEKQIDAGIEQDSQGILYKGLRVRIVSFFLFLFSSFLFVFIIVCFHSFIYVCFFFQGIHCGEPNCEQDPTTGRMGMFVFNSFMFLFTFIHVCFLYSRLFWTNGK